MIAQRVPSHSLLRDYLALTKPKIISLLLLTALGSMFLAADGNPDPITVLVVLAAGSFAAGGAHAINHFLDRDIDVLMPRTRNRPVASGRVRPAYAMLFGIILNVSAFVLLASFANLISAIITLSGTLFYVFIYTILLKRTTPQNIVIGGAAGSVPPVVGWAAVTGNVEIPALFMFAIIFLWTPPHFWALALMIRDDYAKAGIPMLPVVTSIEKTKRYILIYTIPLIAVTLSFATTAKVGWFYFAIASSLGALFLFYEVKMLTSEGIYGAKTTYLYSLLFLAALFCALIVESLVM